MSEVPEILKVKGLYIGMNIDEVPGILREKLARFQDIEDIVGDVKEPEKPLNDFSVALHGILEESKIYAGPDKKVNIISFERRAVAALFDAQNVDFKTFVRRFMDSYNIPKMEEEKVDGCDTRYYTSSAGWRVTIGEGKITVKSKVLYSINMDMKLKGQLKNEPKPPSVTIGTWLLLEKVGRLKFD